jgi:16S rRNA (guanine966-N2)-methyltransferase
MSALGPLLPDARVVDLFAGSGALGLEALSRGARHVTFVENAPGALRVLEKNIAALQPEAGAVEVVRGDALRYAAALRAGEFDLAFADPPYLQGHALRLREIFEAVPFADVLSIEHSRDEPLQSALAIRERRYGDTLLTFLSPST